MGLASNKPFFQSKLSFLSVWANINWTFSGNREEKEKEEEEEEEEEEENVVAIPRS